MISNLIVEGDVDKDKVKDLANSKIEQNFLSKNILFFDSDKIKNELEEDLTVKEVSIKKSYPNTININIIVREPRLLWEESDGSKYLVDEDGLAFFDFQGGEVGEYETLPKINNKLITLNKVGDKVASQDFVEFIKFMMDNFESEISDKITSIAIDSSKTEITISTDKGYKVYFNSERSAAGQLKNLQQVKNEVKSGNKSLEYVDLRIETRIFYK